MTLIFLSPWQSLDNMTASENNINIYLHVMFYLEATAIQRKRLSTYLFQLLQMFNLFGFIYVCILFFCTDRCIDILQVQIILHFCPGNCALYDLLYC